MSKTSVENPFARGQMPLDSRMMTCAGNQFLGHDEHIISPGRVVALEYGSYNIQTFGRAWGNILLYEGGNLQEVGYLNYDAILALRDLGSRVYEVRYGKQETEWDEDYFGKYECYGKRVRDGVVTLVKWGDCAERWINLTEAEYAQLCAGIEKMPDHHAYFEHYRTRVRPRARGEHRYFLLAHAARSGRKNDGRRDGYGRRSYGHGRPVMPFDRGYGRIDGDYFLLGEPDVWTASCSEMAISMLLHQGSGGWGPLGRPTWDEIFFDLTHYEKGLFVERCHFRVYDLLPAAQAVPARRAGELRVPDRFQADRCAQVQWDESGVRLFPAIRFKDDTAAITLSREIWDWIAGQLHEFEGWYNALLDKQQERRAKGGDPA